ncbi:hypothetical protein D3C71_1542130 [compost metagenome]
MRALDQCRQQTHQTPGQWGFIEQGHLRNLVAPEYPAIQLPHETARQLHLDGSGDAATAQVAFLRILGQRQLQPLGNTIALDQGNFVFQRSQRIAAHPTHHQTAQVVQAVAVHDHEAGLEGGSSGHRAFSGGSRFW